MAGRIPFKESVEELARQAGFDLCGVAAAGDFAELEYFPRWIAENRHGEMRYLETRTDTPTNRSSSGTPSPGGQLKRSSLRNVAPWARSVVVCAINYNSPQPYSTDCSDQRRGWISRYAWGEIDYHQTVLERLRRVEAGLAVLASEERRPEPGAVPEFRSWCYVDTGPLIERVFARYSGVGWLGKNTCIINQQLGSWLFLGVLLTSLPIEPDLPAADRCGSCTRCLDACPTVALTAPYQMDASRCISYLTIEKRADIPEELRAGMGRNVFGCDICQDVCPWNRQAPPALVAGFAPAVIADSREGNSTSLVNPELRRLLHMSPEEFRALFGRSPIKRTKYQGLLRNAIVAAGNSGDSSLIVDLEPFAKGDDPVLGEHALWAIARLRGEGR